MRIAALFTAVLLAVLVISNGCAQDEEVGETAQAIVGGSNDSNDLPANTVVSLVAPSGGACTGTLITPTAILTAQHCITGSTVPQPANGFVWTVQVGNNSSAFAATHTTLGGIVRIPNIPINPDVHDGQDVALLFLAASDAEYTSAAPRRPSFQLPTFTKPPCPPGSNYILCGTFANVGGAGWGLLGDNVTTPTIRQRFEAPENVLQLQLSKGGGTRWVNLNSAWTTNLGDSGGPLYIVRNGFRDVIGVSSALSQIFGGGARWTDITIKNPTVQTWIESQMQDQTANPVAPPHTAKWLTDHGQTPTSWKGELDYLGACRNGGNTADCFARKNNGDDCDCDHWFDHGSIIHDNCPFVSNPDQKDTSNNGIGDVCKGCPCEVGGPDPDKDGICGRCDTADNSRCLAYCQGTKALDSCPTAYNPLQENCNATAEAAFGKPALGDVCDPVPCPGTIVADTYGPETCKPQPFPYQNTLECRRDRLQTQFDTTALGSYSANNVWNGKGFDNRSVISVASTHARFCQGSSTINCGAPQVLSRQQLLVAPQASTPSQPWQRVIMDLLQRGSPLGPWNYGQTTASTPWLAQFDAADWYVNSVVPFAASCIASNSLSPERCLGGSFWLFADTAFGSTERASFDLPSWFQNPEFPVTGLAYCPIPHPWDIGDPPGGANAPIEWAMLPMGNGFMSSQLPSWEQRGIADRELIVPTSLGLLGALRDDGTATFVQNPSTPSGPVDCGGSSVSIALAPYSVSTGWLNAAEPDPRIGGGQYSPLAVSLSGDATQVRALVTATGSLRLAQVAFLRASRTTSPHKRVDAVESFGAPGRFELPSTLLVANGNAGNGRAHLAYTSNGLTTRCTFKGGAKSAHPVSDAQIALGTHYLFVGCRLAEEDDEDDDDDDTDVGNKLRPGALVTADSVLLRLHGSDNKLGITTVEVPLTVSAVGDALGLAPFNPAGPTPPQRSGGARIYSRVAAGVFVAGGHNAQGDPLPDVWFRPLDGSWQQLPASVPRRSLCAPDSVVAPLGDVRAGTYSFRDHKLWLIDVSGGAARLVRMDVDGTFDELARWPEFGNATFYVSLDRDGFVLVTRSTQGSFASVRVELNDSETPIVTHRYAQSARLLTRPIVSSRSYGFWAESLGGARLITRVATLPPYTVSCSNIGPAL